MKEKLVESEGLKMCESSSEAQNMCENSSGKAHAGSYAADVPLVALTRGGIIENVHRGRVAVVRLDDGQTEEAWGDVFAPAFFRSAGKPLQALSALRAGVAETFGWEERHLALMAASHRGTAAQIATLEEMAEKAGIVEQSLVFREGIPIDSRARDKWAAESGSPRKLYHTCAGKHLGMLARCKLAGWPLEHYEKPEHPVQSEVRAIIQNWTGVSEGELHVGRDGCGLPVTAVPLHRIAWSYAKLANPDAAGDGAVSQAAGRIAAAMNAYPELVEGPGRLASLLLADSNIVAKSGAQGLFAIGLRKEKIGIAIHLADGSEMPWGYVALALLRRLGGASKETIARLEEAFPAEIVNDAGDVAGTRAALV